jgi:DNA-binding CsgD family transcriptional regulator
MLDILTKREKQVALFAREGKSDDEIAVKLSISTSTVKNHIKKIYKKLAVNRRAKLVALLHKTNYQK